MTYRYEFLVEVVLDAEDEDAADRACDDAFGQMGFRCGVFHGGPDGTVECLIVASDLVEAEEDEDEEDES